MLTSAFNVVLEAKELINAKYVWLECKNSEKLIDFYKKFGFEKIDNFISKDRLAVMMMKLDRKNWLRMKNTTVDLDGGIFFVFYWVCKWIILFFCIEYDILIM